VVAAFGALKEEPHRRKSVFGGLLTFTQRYQESAIAFENMISRPFIKKGIQVTLPQ